MKAIEVRHCSSMAHVLSILSVASLLASDDAVPAEIDDLNLLDAAAAEQTFGNPERFLEIYERYYEQILNYLYRRTGDREIAADITSHTFIKALQWLQTHEVRNFKVKPWLYQVATNTHLQHTRSHRRWLGWLPFFGASAATEAKTPCEVLALEKEYELLNRLLNILPEKYKTPLLLRFYEELSFREIASVLGIAESSARSRVSRALQKLQRQLEDQ